MTVKFWFWEFSSVLIEILIFHDARMKKMELVAIAFLILSLIL